MSRALKNKIKLKNRKDRRDVNHTNRHVYFMCYLLRDKQVHILLRDGEGAVGGTTRLRYCLSDIQPLPTPPLLGDVGAGPLGPSGARQAPQDQLLLPWV